MYRYYKISQKWAEKLGETLTAVKHPDGMYLVTPNLGLRISEVLAKETGTRLLPAEAFEAIGAIGLSVAEAQASAKGELRHDRELDPADSAKSPGNSVTDDNDDNDDNAEKL